MFLPEHVDTCINQYSAEYIQDEVETLYQFNTNGNKYDAENDGHNDTYKQHPAIEFLSYFKKSEYEDEDEYIINAQRPFH
jgi:hypothetical protein